MAARERLARDQLTLDIDPLKDIASPAAPQTEDEVRAELFPAWKAVNNEVASLPSITHRAYLYKKLEAVLTKMNKAGIVERKDNIVEQIAHCRRRVEFCRRSPNYVFQQVGAHIGTRALTLWNFLDFGIFIPFLYSGIPIHFSTTISKLFLSLL